MDRGRRAEAGICLMGMSCCPWKYCFVPDVTSDERWASLLCVTETNQMRQAGVCVMYRKITQQLDLYAIDNVRDSF